MAKRKGISISLAAKCQLLFGLAVLVIIAGALAVPWQRMEQLAKQPNIKAARLDADLYFRLRHAGYAEAGLAGDSTTVPAATVTDATLPSTRPTTRPAWNVARLSDETYAPPMLYVLETATGNFRGGRTDALATKALAVFRERGQETEFGEVTTLKTATGEASRVYRYAAAVRLQASCLNCHSEFREWAPAGFTPQMPSTTAQAAAAADSDMVWPVVGVVRVDVPYQTDENQLLLNRIVIVVAGMVGGALAIVVFYLITSRLILQPVRVLKNTAEKVSAGDLNIRSAISTGDEFQHLSETFNQMLTNLKSSRDQLEATAQSLDTRVGELAQSNIDLFEANRVKSEFLTNVTHELRTPLNAIIGFADLMAETASRGGDAKQQRYSENIRTSAKQLLDLINDLLDLAKIEAGKLVLREEKVNVADVCEAMANFMKPLAQKKAILLELSIDPSLPLITTDPGRFQQILYNFLSNAIKFTPNEGRVTITARSEREAATDSHVGVADEALVNTDTQPEIVKAVRISISDTGPGISADDQKVIFEKFRQLDGSVTRHHAGSGLGLAISRELTNMLGGRIELASTLGKGSTFALVMPVENPNRTMQVHTMLENR